MGETKSIMDLVFADFDQHPAWSWADMDDESLVESIDCQDELAVDHGAVFVLADLLLHDGTALVAVLSITIDEREDQEPYLEPYVIDLPNDDGTLETYGLRLDDHGMTKRQRMAARLGKTYSQVFPIAYKTACVFKDGQRIEGCIE